MARERGGIQQLPTAGTTSTRGRDGIHELLGIETSRATADTLTTLRDGLAHGVGISGPSARRATHAAAQAPAFAGAIRTHHQARDILGNPAPTVCDSPRSLLMCVYNPGRALCHRLDATDSPRRDRCRPSCANIARTDHHAAGLLAHSEALEKHSAPEALRGPLADRLARRAGQLRELADRHEHDRIHRHERTG
ncbi:hypothetical protein [Streptomyces sp. NPDC001933]|uniref:hypothetical protein n=1 Tax=Streptomyces sp. NPDC001933 TaxID=3364626 RepID=UPI0036CF30FA